MYLEEHPTCVTVIGWTWLRGDKIRNTIKGTAESSTGDYAETTHGSIEAHA